jgi:hypothetical protein
MSIVILGTAACLCSCVRTTIRSGLAPGLAPEGWTDRWHHTFLFGLDEVPGPIAPEQVCPHGWAQIDTALDPMQSAIAALTLGVYTPSTVTVVCADPRYRQQPGR